MLKRDELTTPNSCLNKAKDDEPIFVILGRDISGASTVRKWAADRVYHGKNEPTDAQIQEALDLADKMTDYRANLNK